MGAAAARWLQDNGLRASSDDNDLSSGLLMLICGDAIRPGLAWMLTRTHRYLALVMAEARDPAGFARLRELAEAGPASSLDDARYAATRVATLMACKGGVVSDITVGDCVELADTQRRVHARGGQRKVDFYLRLRSLGIFPADAPVICCSRRYPVTSSTVAWCRTLIPRRVRRLRCPPAGSVSSKCRAGRCGTMRSSRT